MWQKSNRAASERRFHATPVAKGQREKLRRKHPLARPFFADFANRSRTYPFATIRRLHYQTLGAMFLAKRAKNYITNDMI